MIGGAVAIVVGPIVYLLDRRFTRRSLGQV
jgi:hypothetical protein